MRARLLVLADGGPIRRAEHVTDYDQRAIVAEVEAERPRRGVAWERFTAEGPLALLPYGDRYALVWSVRSPAAENLLGLSDPEFLARLREAFGGRLGDFRSASPRSAFPLSLRRSAIDPRREGNHAGADRPRLEAARGDGDPRTCPRQGDRRAGADLLTIYRTAQVRCPSPAAGSTVTRESDSPTFWSGSSRIPFRSSRLRVARDWPRSTPCRRHGVFSPAA